ncbi:uncharacterized protein AB675_5979 [Cyphellophora attinorum]|uniref:Uncharacterized protein n=1 Tax=Cyphellophora attinorum TaxID=1664694 RepID=A0A0N1H6F6_9EURO|nr:uncharacterized protein AB675_5979 [Phialophora attinorum]KPI36917.1 hypothetical protein AB675_5979 [Phialophora attinorum]
MASPPSTPQRIPRAQRPYPNVDLEEENLDPDIFAQSPLLLTPHRNPRYPRVNPSSFNTSPSKSTPDTTRIRPLDINLINDFFPPKRTVKIFKDVHDPYTDSLTARYRSPAQQFAINTYASIVRALELEDHTARQILPSCAPPDHLVPGPPETLAARKAGWAEAVLRRTHEGLEEEAAAVWRARALKAVRRVVLERWRDGLAVPAWLVPAEGSRVEYDGSNDDERTKWELSIASALLVRLFGFGVMVTPADGSVPFIMPQALVVGARRTQAVEAPRVLPQALVVGTRTRQEFEAASTGQRAEARVGRAGAEEIMVGRIDGRAYAVGSTVGWRRCR